MRLLIVIFALVWSSVLGASTASAVSGVVEGDSLTGRVFNSTNNIGLSGYSVRLIPPRASGLPVRVSLTGPDGRFRFNTIGKRRYVLEISRGITVVHRKEIDTGQPQRFQVGLRPIAARLR